MSNKATTNIVIAVIVFGILGIIYYLFKDKIMAMIKGGGTDANTGGTTPTNEVVLNSPFGSVPSTPKAANAVLRKGSRGAEVRELQVQLNNYLDWMKATVPALISLPTLTEDGVFGSITEQVLETVTKRKSITLSALIDELNAKMKRK